MAVILASNSPRRRALLGWLIPDFQVRPADVDETPLPDESAPDYVLRLAASKANAVVNALQGSEDEGALVIAADTTVVDGNQILGKPVDNEDAVKMLEQLRGRSHQVYTAIAVAQKDQLFTDLCRTDVPMRQYSDQEMMAYIATGDPFDKAGGYAIQHGGFRPVTQLSGCYANVVGLPLCHLARALRKVETGYDAEIPAACLTDLGYECSISKRVLAGQ